ncbi:MAG: anthranilate phosphoribosyltransferase, partial [Acidimicrobiia bacterium]|nr:anthranilate phosphoribosyltransferase [Acidimicrobiia bacterium]
LVVAGAGVPVCKHGNRSASSKCGTADVLEALGARIELTPEQVVRCVNVAGFGFIFAQKFHPAFRHVGPVRRELGVPTIFNLLGPMANPAPVAYMLVGVANPARMGTMAAALAQRTTASLVVHGHGGLDELSLAGANRVIATRNAASASTVSPANSDCARRCGSYGNSNVSQSVASGSDRRVVSCAGSTSSCTSSCPS